MTALARAPALAAPASFSVELPQFSGPLELLLTLIREEEVDIYDIPIARVAEQFVQRIRTLELNEAAEYLEMAARLLRIKAQLLLPRPEGDEAWEDPRAELVRRLLDVWLRPAMIVSGYLVRSIRPYILPAAWQWLA